MGAILPQLSNGEVPKFFAQDLVKYGCEALTPYQSGPGRPLFDGFCRVETGPVAKKSGSMICPKTCRFEAVCNNE